MGSVVREIGCMCCVPSGQRVRGQITSVTVKIRNRSTASKSLALWVASETFNCEAAAAIQAPAKAMGRPFFSQPFLIRAPRRAVSASGRGVVKRARKRPIRSRRLAPQFFASTLYSISARVNSETANALPARTPRYADARG